ncbi:MAG TPA: dihydrolipoamide acetyltransferase family protein [Chloroflexota bacterium]
MATPVTMPVLSTTMEEGTVAEWLKREGESVARDEPLLMVEMDKGTLEVPAPASGVLRRIVVQPGVTVPVRTLIAEIGAADEVLAVAPAAVILEAGHASERVFASPRARMRARALDVDLSLLRGSGPSGRIVEADVLAVSRTAASPRVAVTPVARRLAEEHGVALTELQGTGPGGRVTQDDVLRAAQQRPAPPREPAAGVPIAPAAGDARPGSVQPPSRIRRITAERMLASAQTTARVSLFLDADFSEAVRFRRQLEPEFERLGVARLPWDAVIARAAALGLAEHRRLLAQWVEGQGLRQIEDVNVGVAVALEPEGLVVPVLRNAHTRSLRDLSGDLLDLVAKARVGRLSPAEMQGGSFSITNLGAYRVDGFTPILNPPETAILGVGRIADRAVVVDGALVARTMCTLSLSFDHRVADGAPAAAFLARVAELLERPYALLGI